MEVFDDRVFPVGVRVREWGEASSEVRVWEWGEGSSEVRVREWGEVSRFLSDLEKKSCLGNTK